MESVKSTHQALVVSVSLQKHPQADNLSIVSVFDGGYHVVVNTNDWKDKTKAVYVVPDSIVNISTPEFAWLADQAKPDGSYRVRCKKFRGVMSEGLLIPARNSAEIGEDLAAELNITRYDPDQHEPKDKKDFTLGGQQAKYPSVRFMNPKYNIESWNKEKWRFTEGEQVIITEKIHGTNARYLYHEDQMYCGSREEWKREFPNYDHVNLEDLTLKVGEERAREIMDKIKSKKPKKNLWWEALEQNPFILSWCKMNPGKLLFGEVFGQVQDLKYTAQPNQLFFAAFDVMDTSTGKFYDLREAEEFGNMQWVPEMYAGPYSDDKVRELTSGKSLWWGGPPCELPSHIREGCVVRSLKEEVDLRHGRKVLKSVSSEYLATRKR